MKVLHAAAVLLALIAAGPVRAALEGDDLGIAAQLLGDGVDAKSAARALAREPSRSRELNDLAAELLWRACTGKRDLPADTQAWLAKALGRTRDARYWDVLDDCIDKSPDAKVQDEADEAQAALDPDNPPQFMGGSLDLALIQERVAAAGSDGQFRSARVKRVQRELASDEPRVVARVAKDLLARNETDRAVLDEVATRIYLNEPTRDEHMANALAWLCKVLARSGDGRYRSFLERVSDRAASARLRSHAAVAAASLPEDESWQWSYKAPKKVSPPATAPAPAVPEPPPKPKPKPRAKQGG